MEIDIDYIAIGKRIRSARLAKKMTQETLSNMIDVTPTYISTIENGHTKLSLSTLLSIAQILDTTVVLIDSGKFSQPEQKPVSLLQYGNGIYDGLELFVVKDGKKIERKINNRHLNPIELGMVSSEQCYSAEKISMLLKNAGDSKDIIFPYELLIVAYQDPSSTH